MLVFLFAIGSPARAGTSYTWTNADTGNLFDYWTNSVNWNPSTGTPGAATSDNAFLTDQINFAYTNLLNSTPAHGLTTLAISNALGEAWLIVTNGASAATTLTTATLALGSGGRLQIDNGGVVTGITSVAWTGTNGAIYLDNGGKLFTTAAVSVGGGVGGVTGLVSSISGPGNGGVWNLNNNSLTVGGGTVGSVLAVNSGAVLTNLSALTLSGNQNSLLATNGGKVFGAGNIAFTGYGNTLNLGGGSWSLGNQNFVFGGTVGSSNNTLVGGTLTIGGGSSGVWIGGTLGSGGGNFNSFIFTNANGGFFSSEADFYVGASYNGTPGGNNNTVILSNSLLTLGPDSVPLTVGNSSSNNSLTLLANTVVNGTARGISIGAYTNSDGNLMVVNGALVTNVSTLTIGSGPGTGSPSVSNQLVVENGGMVSNVTFLVVGGARGAGFNSLIVTNGGGFSMLGGSGGAVLVGSGVGGTVGGGNNSVIVSNSVLQAYGNASYIGSGSSNNTVTALNTVWNQGYSNFGPYAVTIGTGGAVGNSLTLNDSALSNANALIIGNGAGAVNYGNSAIMTNGSQLTTASITIGTGGSSNNVFTVDGGPLGSSVVSNLSGGVLGVTIGTGGSSSNLMTVANSTVFLNSGALTIGGAAGSSNNALLINGGGVVTNVQDFVIGGAAGANGNSLIVTNGGRLIGTSGNIMIGASFGGLFVDGGAIGGGNNTVILSNSLMQINTAPDGGYPGYGPALGSGSSNNTLTLLARTVWDNGDALLNIGGGNGGPAAFNVLTVNNAILTNMSGLNIGDGTGGPAISNQMIVLNGGIVSNVASVIIGSGQGNSFNSLIVTGGGSFFMNGAITVGASGGGNNSALFSNSLLQTLGNPSSIGSGSSNNTVTLYANTVYNGGGVGISIGTGAAVGNVLTVNGGILTNTGVALGGNQNSLVISNGGQMLGLVTFNTFGDTLTLGSGGFWNINGGLSVGSTANLSNNTAIIGGTVTNVTSLFVGGGNSQSFGNPSPGANFNSLIVTNDGRLVMNSGQVYIGAVDVNAVSGGTVGGGNNTVILSNSFIQTTSDGYGNAFALGSGSSNNTLTLLANTVVNNNGLNLSIGGGGGGTPPVFNVLTVNGGLITNAGNLSIGASGISNQMIVMNGGIVSNVLSLTVGGGTLSAFNSLVVTGGGSFVMSPGASGEIGGPGGNNNSLLISNTQITFNGLLIGFGGNRNTVSVPVNSVLNGGSNTINVGISDGTIAATGNVLSVNGGLLTNVTSLVVGSGSAYNNRLLITNGAQLQAGSLTIGTGGLGNNIFAVSGGPLGNSSVSNPGGALPITIGTLGSSSNQMTVANATVFMGGGALTIGNSTAGNSVIVSTGGQITNVIGLTVGSGSGANFNSLIVTNGGQFFMSSGGVTIGSSGNNNAVILSNSLLTLTVAPSFGNSGSNNTLTLLDNTLWNEGNLGLTIGTGVAASNVVSITGVAFTNIGALTIGNSAGSIGNELIVNQGSVVSNLSSFFLGKIAGANGNGLVITNGGLVMDAGLTIGNAAGANGNFVTVTGSGSVWTNSGVVNAGGPSASNLLTIANGGTVSATALNIGVTGGNNTVVVTDPNSLLQISGGIVLGSNATSSGNQLIISNFATVSTGDPLIGNGSSSNSVSVLANATWNLNGQLLAVGNGVGGNNAVGNQLLINTGGQVAAGAVNVGALAGDNNNSILVLNSGVLEATSLVIAAGTTGNTISNRGGVYQFTTATPTITPGAAGSIAINSGTISFRGIDNADVTADQPGNALSPISFSGTNTFMLNSASNINVAAGVDQTYTFQVVGGTPTHYANLVMVNGQTEYGNGDLTIGASGTLLISNTTAAIDGNFVNSGTASVVNAIANFANTINNHGLLALQNATLNATAFNFATGTIHGNGTISSDVSSLGTISPVGTLTFAGNLTLGGSSVVIMELTGYGNGVGTNDVINVGEGFEYGGKLVVTNTTGFTYAFGQEFYLFNFTSGNQLGDFSSTNLPNLTPYGLAWNTAQLDSQGLLIVVPEPSEIMLVAYGMLLLAIWYLSRRQHRS